MVRSKRVASDFEKKGEAGAFEMFAAMPALEAKRMLFRMATLKNKEQPSMKYKLVLLGVKKTI